MSYRLPRPLTAAHELEGFVCASAEQTDWLARHARQSMATGTTKVFVVTLAASEQVVAYYAWTMAQIDLADASARLRKGAGRYPQPVASLARLGVHQDHEGRGLGAALLRDVIERVAALSEEIGCRGLLVHCESEQAGKFYVHLVPEFESSPTGNRPGRASLGGAATAFSLPAGGWSDELLLLLKDIKRTLRRGPR